MAVLRRVAVSAIMLSLLVHGGCGAEGTGTVQIPVDVKKKLKGPEMDAGEAGPAKGKTVKTRPSRADG